MIKPAAPLFALLLLGVVAPAVAQPRKDQDRLPRVVVLVDTSRSMGIRDRLPPKQEQTLAKVMGVKPERLRQMSRLERAQAVLRGAAFKTLSQTHELLVYSCAEKYQQVTLSKALEADGSRSDLGLALLRAVLPLESTGRVAAVILISDGRWNGTMNANAAASRLGKAGIPIHTVVVGDSRPQTDVWIEEVVLPGAVQAGDRLKGRFDVRVTGLAEAQETKVSITVDGKQVYEAVVTLGGEHETVEVPISVVLHKSGQHTLRLSVEPLAREVRHTNNTRIARVRAVQDKIRVLYMEAYPRWEYRYLKNMLLRDSAISLQTFLSSADPSFVQESSRGVPALTKPPTVAQLKRYQVVILGDLGPKDRDRMGRPLLAAAWLKALRERVKTGGSGLLVIAGERSAPWKYAGTPLTDMLPVVVDPGPLAPLDASRPWRPKLTRMGHASPLMRLEPEAGKNRRMWDGIQPVYWYARVKGSKPQARVLAVHPGVKTAKGAMPVIAWQRYGAGLCFWMGIDETWRWRAEVGNKYVGRYYGQILRFMAHRKVVAPPRPAPMKRDPELLESAADPAAMLRIARSSRGGKLHRLRELPALLRRLGKP